MQFTYFVQLNHATNKLLGNGMESVGESKTSAAQMSRLY
jgi:hypothetical protein